MGFNFYNCCIVLRLGSLQGEFLGIYPGIGGCTSVRGVHFGDADCLVFEVLEGAVSWV